MCFDIFFLDTLLEKFWIFLNRIPFAKMQIWARVSCLQPRKTACHVLRDGKL